MKTFLPQRIKHHFERELISFPKNPLNPTQQSPSCWHPPGAGSDSQKNSGEVPVDAVDLVGLHGRVVAERAEEVVAPAARALLAAHRGPLLAAEVAHL